MRTLIFILMFLLSSSIHSQNPWQKSSPFGYNWKNVGLPGFSNLSYGSSLAFSPAGEPYVAFSDGGHSDKVTVMRFDGTNWVNVGNAGFSSGAANTTTTSLAFSTTGEPYVAFEDISHSLKASVMKFDGNEWIYVGSAGFSPGQGVGTSLAISPTGDPYVAFRDGANSFKVTVMKFNGTNWVIVGSAGISPVFANSVDLEFSFSGELYVAFADYEVNSGHGSVMKFDGTIWVNVGQPGFTPGAANLLSIAFSSSDQPYVAFFNVSSRKVMVMNFDGNNWVNIVPGDISPSETIESLSFAFSPINNQPYVVFQDSAFLYRATMKKFDGTNWMNVGSSGFSEGLVNYLSLAFSTSGIPYVAYHDYAYHQRACVMKYDSIYTGAEEYIQPFFIFSPNPAITTLRIGLKHFPDDPISIKINDINGNRMFETQTYEKTIQIDVESYPIGVYIVMLKNESSIWHGKFCKY